MFQLVRISSINRFRPPFGILYRPLRSASHHAFSFSFCSVVSVGIPVAGSFGGFLSVTVSFFVSLLQGGRLKDSCEDKDENV